MTLNLSSLLTPTSRQCLLCRSAHKGTDNLCPFCKAQLPWLQTHCQCCAIPLVFDGVCGACQTNRPPFSRCIAAFSYEQPIAQLINRFKDNGDLTAGRLLSDLLAEKLQEELIRYPDLLVPVPLHWRRQFKRGFNQSLDIALRLSTQLGIPCQDQLLTKTRATKPQHNLSRKQRLKNLKFSFEVSSADLKGKHIALIDDVLTTGSTATTLTNQLLKAGASVVEVWCIARTPLH
jgi:ComF family protein